MTSAGADPSVDRPSTGSPVPKRVAARITADALRQVRAGHPWVFDDSVLSLAEGGRVGDLAVVFDDKRKFAAIGLLDPASPIRIKVLHQGKPAQIDGQFWAERIRTAGRRRAELADGVATTGYRLVNGESDGLPALVIDRYGDVAVIKLYSAAWFAHLDAIVQALVAECHPSSVVLRLARNVVSGPTFGHAEGDALHGTAPDAPVMFVENGLAFEADVVNGQKTGHFLDQRDNRQLLRHLVADIAAVNVEGGVATRGHRITVLDAFASTGGFTVYAAAGGAASVTAIDQSEPTLAVAARNLAHNRALPTVASCSYEPLVGDAFEQLERLGRNGRKYDIVVVDPPSFAQRAANVTTAIQAYERLAGLASRLVVDGGLLVQASCSARVSATDFFRAVHAGASRVGRDLVELRRTGHAIDHPADFAEGHYLKAIFARVERTADDPDE